MLNLLQWDKPLKVNGKVFNNSSEAYEAFKEFDGNVEIELNISEETDSKGKTTPKEEKPLQEDKTKYRIKVKKYMTKQSTPSFDFMKKWNNDVPMPMRTMVGEIIGETPGMYKMKLHGRPEKTTQCLHCGRTLTNKISIFYGIGPICGKHFYIEPPKDFEEYDFEKDVIEEKLYNTTWTGWVIKSAIEEKTVLQEEEVVESNIEDDYQIVITG